MTQQEAHNIDGIMSRFDFEKVHRYMVETDWKWLDEVPQMEDLRRTALRLLVEAQMDQNDVTSMGTGGFRVYKLPWGLELVFAMNRAGSF
jgi:hypothetical protein